MTTEAPETALVKRPKYWEIADDLQAYAATLELIDAQLAACNVDIEVTLLEAERTDVIDKIAQLHEAALAKTDSTAGVIRRMKSDIAAKKAERDRLATAVKADERALEGLESYVSRVMDSMGKTHLKGTQSMITLRGNGGVAPLRVDGWDNDKERWTGKSILPDEFAKWEGRFTNHQMIGVRAALVEDGWESGDIETLFAKFTRVPANTLIRAALAEPCPDCDGLGFYEMIDGNLQGNKKDCETCGGSGKNAVPGCSLGARGVRLDIR